VPEEIENDSNSAATNDANSSSENGGIESNALREILYLDIDRIGSYLSQIEDGLNEYQQNIEGGADAETSQSWGMGLAGALPVHFNWGAGTQVEANTNLVIQQKRRHHAALHVFERAIERKGLLGGLGDQRPFVKLVDYAMLLDYAVLKELFSRFTDLQYSLSYAGENVEIENLRETAAGEGPKALSNFDNKLNTSRKKTKAEAKRKQEYYDHYANVFREFGDQLDLVIPNQDVIGRIEREYLSVSPKFFTATYGAPTRKAVTVIGLDVAGEAQVSDLKAPDQEDAPEGMAYAAAFLMQSFYKTLGKTFASSGMHAIIPIALYMDLEQQGGDGDDPSSSGAPTDEE
jgi:hypothetical protein